MKRLIPLLGAAGVLVAFVATIVFLVWKAREVPEEFEVKAPFRADIVQETVATGAIVPRTEVAIKSRVSGVVDALPVKPGDQVQIGDLIAVIRIIPDVQAQASAESQVQTARIQRDMAKEELARAESLSAQSAISVAEITAARGKAQLAEEALRASQRTLQIVKEGHAGGSVGVSTHITSTVSGMVLSVDIKVGQSVTETNTFNEGTTIATVADMSDMIFQGKVDESEVAKIKEGMDLDLEVGALGDQPLTGKLAYISPKGLLADGAVQFAIEADVTVPDGVMVRAGSSANASIVLDRRDGALAIRESWLRFEKGAPYVEVATGPQVFERRDVTVGLSDGLVIEVTGGLTEQDQVKAGAIKKGEATSGGGSRRFR